MPRLMLIAITALLVGLPVDFIRADQQETTSNSPDVPAGEVLPFTFEGSKIFPGTTRDYWVYIPAQYDPAKPACVYVNQDGVQYDAPHVFDKLIANGEMPVTIGVFVMHGRVPAADGNAALDRYNRSYEYDGLGDNYARFLLEELLPDVETKTATDGRAIRLSTDPNDRAIGGASSGAVCAFTVAWERPDAFRRVFSAIGTYVGLRGADRYHTLIRKTEPKPIRIFLQDGSNDLDIYGGDWWMANQSMQRSLAFAGYDVNYVWGDGGHNGQHATAIFPDAMRWLWRDYPQPIQAGRTRNDFYSDLIDSEHDWELAATGEKFTVKGLAANSSGEVVFINWPKGKSQRIDHTGKVGDFLPGRPDSSAQAFGPDGRLYIAADRGEILAYDNEGHEKPVAPGVRGQNLIVARNGNLYVIEADDDRRGEFWGQVWLIRPDGSKQVVDEGSPTAMTLSPDQSLLYVANRQSHMVDSHVIQKDGSLAHKQKYFWLHERDAGEAGPSGLCTDQDGRLYVATRSGIQICDQAGRVHLILPLPRDEARKDWEHPGSICFGGEQFDTLFVSRGKNIYKRKLNVRGTNAWDAPVKPEKPRL